MEPGKYALMVWLAFYLVLILTFIQKKLLDFLTAKMVKYQSVSLKVIGILNRFKYLFVLYFFVATYFWMREAIRYYFLTQLIAWIIIFTLGLYVVPFIFPWTSIILPFQKKTNEAVNLMISLTGIISLGWIVRLLRTGYVITLDTSPYEGQQTSQLYRFLVIGSIIFHYIFSMLYYFKLNYSKEVEKNK
ncbi:hypothetical protein M2139_001958 [Enterococcus sp. PF1-24]|uniref:hypothetical protein n=1 Tax=unclassified Enterococcus TaxID=2608891 RepID=UPI0024754498|nr:MULTISPECIES: hypothetical protein [unclassified Enterococcus]MDH6364957.1 hypothetical protein [Enterococcus sp. PFB1-1]MDH6402058.1 hypothetical protein [Enterococcus sp. PF1-24]